MRLLTLTPISFSTCSAGVTGFSSSSRRGPIQFTSGHVAISIDATTFQINAKYAAYVIIVAPLLVCNGEIAKQSCVASFPSVVRQICAGIGLQGYFTKYLIRV